MSRYLGSARLARCGRIQGSLDAQHPILPAAQPGRTDQVAQTHTAPQPGTGLLPPSRQANTCESRLCISAAMNATGAVRGASQPGQQPSAAS